MSSRLLSPAEAEAAIRQQATQLPAVHLPLAALSGAVLRESITSTRDQPPFDRVTMDGIAFSFESWQGGRNSFRIAGTQAAGAAPLTLPDRTDCIEVMTGAMLPIGCDCVVPVENIDVSDGIAQLRDDAPAPVRNVNVHARGIDSRRGDLLLPSGCRLGPAEVAVIASNGQTHASVARPPRIVVISTGDELVEPGQPLQDWQISRSNVYAVLASLRQHGYSTLSHDHVPDDLPKLRERLRSHLAANDVMILSGGVSMGRFDYVPQVLQELGVRMIFHKVAQRPGKPLWFGVGSGGQTVYALPGNPVSTLVCLTRYVLPGLQAAQGATARTVETISLAQSYEVKPPLAVFLPVTLTQSVAGQCALPHPTRGSGDFTSLIGTVGFVELPPGPRVVMEDASLPLYRW
ncbi:molybdopterin molybdenumtransferase MoeA [Steroidobacter agaridevorans]|uniref:Molybdopterin molybdenumtransferase n=1 Tax=Steroidobacter agaridevorans TaxID=2695856 RepID=A0A829Y9T4_9GAMM|nr:molybdopterin molybdotransferase MoeA [Steroidobacter agaridevorans]GFE79382.1 molybdopterin molybdenumtransferase MoeA [Steroidobacter agaridevorans]